MAPQDHRELLKVDPKPRDGTSAFSLAHLTAYSVHWLEIWGIATTYENISVLNARLFPADFGMAGFPELPDGLRTNRSLLQMRPKYRGFATSNPRKGVYLTDKGHAEVARVIEAIGVPTFDGEPARVETITVDPRAPRNKGRSYNPAQDVEDRRSRLLFRRFKEGRFAETDVVHLLGLFGLYDHTPPVEIRKAFKELRDAANIVGDSEFLEFLDAVSEKFRVYLERPDPSHRKE